jgi:hypothetical protein
MDACRAVSKPWLIIFGVKEVIRLGLAELEYDASATFSTLRLQPCRKWKSINLAITSTFLQKLCSNLF